MKNIYNYNTKNELHGYQNWYFRDSNKLYFRGNYKNDRYIGYNESHNWKITRYNIR